MRGNRTRSISGKNRNKKGNTFFIILMLLILVASLVGVLFFKANIVNNKFGNSLIDSDEKKYRKNLIAPLKNQPKEEVVKDNKTQHYSNNDRNYLDEVIKTLPAK